MKAFGKVFMSHKSKNKGYVEYIVNRIGRDRCIYDKYTFEEGMETLDEIFRSLNETDLFVIFLTKDALMSRWVRTELRDAYKKLNSGQLSSIFPIIIEEGLNFDDDLIPKWMQSRYNIKPVLSPKSATEKILSKLRELSWGVPEIMLQASYFGRNDEIKAFEARYANLDIDNIECLIASGFEYIGRKSYMEHCLKKLNIMRDSHRYTLFNLERDESIEDLILKIINTGFIKDDIRITNIIHLGMDEKINLTASLIKQVQLAKQYIFINDNGVIVKPNGEVVWWFEQILEKINNCIVLGIAAKYKVKSYRATSKIFSIPIGELNPSERKAMLIKLCNDLELEISRDDLKTISGILSGYPQQVLLAARMLDEDGVEQTISNLSVIRDYSKDKAYMALSLFETNKAAMDFLNFLCCLDFVDKETLNEIFVKDETIKDIYHQFMAMSICAFIGSDREYICVSSIIRDYVNRSKIELSKFYQALLSSFKSIEINEKWAEEASLAKYYSVIKQKLLDGEVPPTELVLPSHYVKSIIMLYNNQKYKTAIKLAESILNGDTISIFDDDLKRQFYTYFCQSLAREHNDNFFNYYRDITLKNSDQKFLLGFYYRINNKPDKAIENLLSAIHLGNTSPRTKRELVNSYIISDDYESALFYSKENYDSDIYNPFYIQSYFKCLINSRDYMDHQ